MLSFRKAAPLLIGGLVAAFAVGIAYNSHRKRTGKHSFVEFTHHLCSSSSALSNSSSISWPEITAVQWIIIICTHSAAACHVVQFTRTSLHERTTHWQICTFAWLADRLEVSLLVCYFDHWLCRVFVCVLGIVKSWFWKKLNCTGLTSSACRFCYLHSNSTNKHSNHAHMHTGGWSRFIRR